ncbi:abscission/NoCut checkpoint regulator-like isoform X2 [Amphibalanus amphitrite]|uniref:abscission/NoCut checkpoint regulator-like isoform X2 n=2 Tax=Amphibalanus amphitrite TaxID=1232801 RepID=UPI001C917C71|nr:abscission/NoCut checkpoint regulator-like isoform X2 [Amphibalanus amphitrite]
MSCSSCFSKYNFFFREHGCPICHMSLCSKCLPEKLPIDGKKQSVCRKCYNKATTIEDEAPPLVPPEALKRRLEDLENPARPPIVVYRQSPRAASLKRGLSHQDSELVDRLEALKADRKAKNVPTESEMAARLAALKGEPCTSSSSGPSGNLPPPERRTAAEQEDDLLAETKDQLAIAARYRPEEGLQERLERLRGGGADPGPAPAPATTAAGETGGQRHPQTPASADNQSPADLVAAVSAEVAAEVERANQIAQKVADIHHRLEDVKGLARDGRRGGPATSSNGAGEDTEDPSEDQEVQRLIRQVTEEAALEDKELNEELESISSVDDEELPWCCICNEDAAVRCAGCSGDLYCRSCFKEGHNDQLADHQWSPFPTPKESK